MIGNDIVDLAQAKQESNWRRRGFLDKVFTDHEKQLIHMANDPDCMVWLLWSMKESAYKLVTRQTGKRVFAPNKIFCQITSTQSETVEGFVFYEGTCHTQSILTDRYVATTASNKLNYQFINQLVNSFNNATYQTQYIVIREKIKQYCAIRFSIPETSIHIHKNETGVPILTIDGQAGNPQHLPLSISHHGYYGAYVIELSAIEATV